MARGGFSRPPRAIAFTLCLFCSLSCARTADLPDNATDANKQGDVSSLEQEVVADVVSAKGDFWGTLTSKLQGKLQKGTTTPATSSSVPATTTLPQTAPPATTGVATSLVAINFLTRITTFSPANFTAPYQAQYIQGVQASAPNILEVFINSIVAGSVIVNTTVVTTNSSAPAVVDAASGGFNQTLPPSIFGQPTVSAVTVTPASLAILSATPPTLIQPPPTSGPSGPPATTPPPPTFAGPTGTTGPVPPSTPPVTQNYFIGPTSAAPPPTTINGSNQTVIIGPVG